MRMIFVNLPVKDLDASRAFFGELGFDFDPQFSDDECACMVVEGNIYVMLSVEERFKDFVNGDIADPATTEVLTCLTVERREQVDETIAEAIAAGGKSWRPAVADGPMYGGSFQDPDGHVWELMHLQV